MLGHHASQERHANLRMYFVRVKKIKCKQRTYEEVVAHLSEVDRPSGIEDLGVDF
jgi:hypothetical protein